MVSPVSDHCLFSCLLFCEEKTVMLEQLCVFPAMTVYFVMYACASLLNSMS